MTLNKGHILEGHLTAGENFGRYPTAGGSFLTAESKEKSKKTFSFIQPNEFLSKLVLACAKTKTNWFVKSIKTS